MSRSMDDGERVIANEGVWSESEHVLVAGGGSGGHVFPALAVADELAGRGWQVSWLGRQRGMERELVEPRGLSYYALPAQAIVGRSPVQRGVALLGLGVSAVRAQRLIRRIDARVVLGSGGFVSAPGVLGATLARRPTVLLEPNVVPGVANRWLSRWATVAAVGAAVSGQALRCPVRETGVPLRSEFAGPAEPVEASGSLHVLVLGGSQGARQLNRLLPAALSSLSRRSPGLEVTHQAGADSLQEVTAAYRDSELEEGKVTVEPFIDDVRAAIGRAHLVVSRAGAITLAEICAVGRPSLLLPLQLAGAHQADNARQLAEAGAAEVLGPEAFTAEAVADALGRITADRERLTAMGEAALRLARPRAAHEVADLIEEVVRAA